MNQRSPRARRALPALVATVWGFTAAVSIPGAREEMFECMEDVVLSWDGADEITYDNPNEPGDESQVCWAEEAREKPSGVLSLAMGAGLPLQQSLAPFPSRATRVIEPTPPDIGSPVQLLGFPTQALAPPVAV